jgi:putative intracellular protease/amidase
MIASNPAVSGQTGWPIGYWAAELAHPYWTFNEAGYQITIASPKGGAIEPDGYSDPSHESGYSAADFPSRGFLSDPAIQEQLAATTALEQLNVDELDALFLVGGQGPMYTFMGNDSLYRFVRDFHASGKPVAVVCHATCILLELTDASGELLVKGKTWTGFADIEEDYSDQAVGQPLQPFRIESRARQIAETNFITAGPFQPFAVADGNLITGQQQQSGVAAARKVIDQIGS